MKSEELKIPAAFVTNFGIADLNSSHDIMKQKSKRNLWSTKRLLLTDSYLQIRTISLILITHRIYTIPKRFITEYLVKGKDKGKGKAVPLQAWSGPAGSRKLR